MKKIKRQLAVFLVVVSSLVGATAFVGSQPAETDQAQNCITYIWVGNVRLGVPCNLRWAGSNSTMHHY